MFFFKQFASNIFAIANTVLDKFLYDAKEEKKYINYINHKFEFKDIKYVQDTNIEYQNFN